MREQSLKIFQYYLGILFENYNKKKITGYIKSNSRNLNINYLEHIEEGVLDGHAAPHSLVELEREEAGEGH